MPLHKIKDFDPNYKSYFDGNDILSYDLYNGREKIGSVDDVLVDDNGRFRYLVAHTGIWIFGKRVLLPVGLARVDYNDNRIYVDGLTKDQVENLPEYNSDMTVDYDYEERVRSVYRKPYSTTAETTAATVETPGTYNRNDYDYNTHDRALFDVNERDHRSFKLYEERLIANRRRHKTGEVAVGKRVETEREHVEVPIEKERVIVEHQRPGTANQAVTPGKDAFNEGEVARVELYEDEPDIHKETVAYDQVNVRKEVDRDTVTADEKLRRERLDVKKQGNPNVDNRSTNRR